MPESLVLPVLGLPVRFTADAPALLDAVEARFGRWRELPGEVVTRTATATFPGPGDAGSGAARLPLKVVLAMRDGSETDAPGRVRHEVLSGRRVRFRAGEATALVDPVRGEARASVTPALLADGTTFRRAFLEAMTLSLVTAFDRTPLHAAGIVRDGTALVLAGPSGAGKSSLAWAALAAGHRLLSEDTLFVQSRPELRVWGLPGPLHLPPGARRHFPELADRPIRRTPAGKRKVVLGDDDLPDAAWASPPLADRAILCMLGRGEGGPAAEPADTGGVVEELTGRLPPGFDRFGSVLPGLVRRLGEGGCWRLTRGEHPRELLPYLQTILDQTRP